MKQLTLGDLDIIIKNLKAKKQFDKSIPIYLGDDEELNGVHECLFCDTLGPERTEENGVALLKMVNDCHQFTHNKFSEKIGRAILLS